MATHRVSHDAAANPYMPRQTADHNPSSVEAGIAKPKSKKDDTSETGRTTDEASEETEVYTAVSSTPEINLPPAAGGEVKESAEGDDGPFFEPFIPQVDVSLARKPAPESEPKSLMPCIDRAIYGENYVPSPADNTTDTQSPTPSTDGSSSEAESAKPGETCTAPVAAPQPPPRMATVAQLVSWTKRCLLAQTALTEDAAELTAFWVISSWFRGALTVYPCLVITGISYDAIGVLHVLKDLCPRAALLAGFRRSDLGATRHLWTSLISEPNLDKRTINLLGSLTDRRFSVVQGIFIGDNSKSTAIYAGENAEPPKIQNSLHIHIAPTNASLPARPQWLQKMMEGVPGHLAQYRDKNLPSVYRRTWTPSGLSWQTATVATELGRCLVGAPELRQKLLTLLQTRDQQRRAEMSDTIQAVVVEAILTLSHDGREHAYCREIAAAANRLFGVRGETVRLRAEHVGHQCKNLGLPTRRLSRTGNGLTFDKATFARINELAAIYMVDELEDVSAESENLHSSQASEKKHVEEVEEVVEVS